MQLKTSRLLIRELIPEDWRSMQKIAVDFQKSQYAIYDMPLPAAKGEIMALTKQFAETHMFYAVLLHEEMIGYICFHEDEGKYDLGYCFHSDYHGKGYAFESCREIMDYIARQRNIKTFTAGTALKNTPSCKLLEKLGFTLEKTEQLSFHKDENGNDIIFEGGIFIKEVKHPLCSPLSESGGNRITIQIIDSTHKQDINIKNEPFKLFGRMVPSYINEQWTYTTERLPEEAVSQMCFPDENYDWDTLAKNSIFVGAYDGDQCIGLAILQQAMMKYMYLYDLKVNANYRGRHIGTMLMEKSKKVALEQGYRGLYTQGQDNNLGACLFYLNNGFMIGGLDTRVYQGTSQEGKKDILFYCESEPETDDHNFVAETRNRMNI